MRCALVAVVVGCAGTPAPPPEPAPPPRPAEAPRGFLGAYQIPIPHEMSSSGVMLVDHGTRALLSIGDKIALLDLDERRMIGEPRVTSSERVPSRLPRPHAAERFRRPRRTLWAWDEARGVLVAAIDIASDVRGVAGLAAWEPANEAVPRMLGASAAMLAISPDGGTLITQASSEQGRDDSIQLFDLRAGLRLGGPLQTGRVGAAAFSRDGERVVLSMFDDHSLMLLTPATGLTVTLSSARVERFRQAAFHPTLPVLVTFDGSVNRLWNFGGPRPISMEIEGAEQFAFSPDGRYLAIDRRARIELLDIVTMEPIGAPYRPPPPCDTADDSAAALEFSADSSRLAVSCPGFLVVLELGPRAPAPPRRDWFADVQRLAVPDVEVPPPFERDGEVSGRVVRDGAPVRGATVVLSPSRYEWPDALALGERSAVTDADGRFQLSGLPRIDWWVRSSAPRQVSPRLDASLRARPRLHRELELTMVAATTIQGKAVGRGAAGAQVDVVSVTNLWDTRSLTAGRDGRFSVDHLSPGTWHGVWVRSASGTAGFQEVKGRGSVQRPSIALHPPGTADVVRVRVRSPDGAPVAGARLVFVALPQLSGVTGADGTFVYAAPPTAKTFEVQVTLGPDPRAAPLSQRVERPFPAEVDFVVTPAP